EGNLLRTSTTLLISLRAREIDEDAAHQPRRHGEEMCAVLPVDLADIDQTDVRLVDERGRLQRMSGSFVSHVPPGDAAQLVMDERNQLLQCGLIAVAPVDQQPGDLVRGAGRVDYHTRTRSPGDR